MEEADLLVRYPQRVPIAPEPTSSTQSTRLRTFRSSMLLKMQDRASAAWATLYSSCTAQRISPRGRT